MNQKPPPFHHLLRDLPNELQKAVHEAVAACQPAFRPRLYASDWLEELYHEAACAACEAWRSYDPAKGSLYAWGLRLIRQRLQRFSDGVWAVCRCEGEWPCDEETGEEVEVEDEGALEAIWDGAWCSQVREALARLSKEKRQLVEWHFGEELSEREIAARLGKSKTWVHERLECVKEQLREWLGAGTGSEKGKRTKRGKKG